MAKKKTVRRSSKPKARRTPARPAARPPKPKVHGEFELLAELCRAVGVSGAEGEVRRIILDSIRRLADDIKVDALGNVIAVKRGARRERVLAAAHMDEVGFMVSGFDADGSVRFETVGGVNEHTLLGKPVIIGPNHVPGVIGAAPIHLLTEERRRTPVKAGQMRLDLGVDSEAAAKGLVKLGERGTFAGTFAVVGPSLLSKALDNRLGCAALIELLRGKPYPFDLYAAFTVQEEIGRRGAKVAAFAADPAAAFVLDATPAYDLPDSSGRENTQYNTRLGRGPAIYLADKGTLYSEHFIHYMQRTAEAAGIPYQLRQPGGGGTDAGAIHLARAGIPTITVSVPHRYSHTPLAVARAEDWRNTVKLMRRALEGFSTKVLKK